MRTQASSFLIMAFFVIFVILLIAVVVTEFFGEVESNQEYYTFCDAQTEGDNSHIDFIRIEINGTWWTFKDIVLNCSRSLMEEK